MHTLIQKVSAICVSVIAAILLLDYHYALMSFNTIFLLLYVIVVFFVSIWTTFILFQNVLGTNAPFKRNSNKLLSILHSPFNNITFNWAPNVNVQPIDERIQHFVDDVESICIRKWYTGYISRDEQFLSESSKLIDIVVRRFLQIAGQINSQKILHGTLTILLRHLKEYKKAVKKAGVNGSVEGHYRYGHLGSKNVKCFEHFAIQLMSKMLQHFVTWELYNSVACRCLNAILARKLLSHMIHLLSAPGFINIKILILLGQDSDRYMTYSSISVTNVDHAEVKVKPVVTQVDNTQKQPDHGDDMPNNTVNSAECKLGLQLRENQRGKEQTKSSDCQTEKGGKTEVKVYESHSADKTWRHSSDLDCISLGQDILFLSNIAEEDVRPDWSQLAEQFQQAKDAKDCSDLQEASESKDVKQLKHPKVKDLMDVKDVKNVRDVHDVKEFKEIDEFKDMRDVKESVSVASSLVKDLQQSTSNAMHKIEDEAAGVVEGILDLGMAGIRKGLRLTGLQDNVRDARPKSESKDIPKVSDKTRLGKHSHVIPDADDDLRSHRSHKNDEKVSFGRDLHDDIDEADSFEDIYMNPLMVGELKEVVSASYEGDILLEVSPVLDAPPWQTTASTSKVIPTMAFLHVEDSPEPEYEDNPDLATTTAKLRSLLVQKAEVGTPLASPIAATPSPLLAPTPQDASGSSMDLSETEGEVDGALPSMYKVWARTVFQNTLNTIKTALPGGGPEEACAAAAASAGVIAEVEGGGARDENGAWHFEAMPAAGAGEFATVLGRFLMERQQFCVVDNAFEAVEVVDLGEQMEEGFVLHEQEHKYEEELDEFDAKIPIAKALIDLACELVEEVHPSLVKENIIKALLLTYGCVIEEHLQELSKQLIKRITHAIGRLPKMEATQGQQQRPLAMTVVELAASVATVVKDAVGQWLSDDAAKSIARLLVEALQSHKINVDTSLQILELFASEVIAACNQSSPTYSV